MVVKINNSGEIIWKSSIEGEQPNKLIIDKDFNVVIITQGDGRVVKFNFEGDTLWTCDYANNQFPITILTGLLLDSDNNIIASGYEFTGSWNYRVKSISPDGADKWVSDFDSPEGMNDFAIGLAIDSEDNIYVTGTTHNQVSVGICYTVKYKSTGEEDWYYRFDPPNSTFENGFNLFVDDSSNVYVGGTTGEPGEGPDFLAFKIFYGPTIVETVDKNIPESFLLKQNYPNPFNPLTNIEFSIPVGNEVKVEIFDVLGNLLEEIMNQYLPAGNYKTEFNGEGHSSGVYYYRISAGRFIQMKKAVLLK